MSRQHLYLLLALAGTVVPWIFFLEFFASFPAAGFIPALFVNGAAGGFSSDLLISSATFWVVLFTESRRSGVSRPWLYVLLNLVVGLSCALPYWLWARERSRVRGHASEM